MRNTKNQAKTQKGQNILNLDENQAREHVEKLLRPDGQPVCPHCESGENAYRMQGKSCRPGLCRCRSCKKQFTVTVGTIFEDSHIPLSLWIKAIHLMTSSKKGMSSLQLQRNLGLGSYKTAWHLSHRIRWAMQCEPMTGMLKGQVQADETYIGGKPRPGDGKDHKPGKGTLKTPVLALVETDGNVHSRPLETVDSKTLRAVMDECIDPSAQIVTDDAAYYPLATANFSGGHQSVNHSAGEYSRKRIGANGEVEIVTTNTAESFFSLLKRGIYGTFHHVSKRHLHRYCSEFDFRWNGRKMTDAERRTLAIQQAEGKRLMFKSPAGN
jgi:transposase-like protein